MSWQAIHAVTIPCVTSTSGGGSPYLAMVTTVLVLGLLLAAHVWALLLRRRLERILYLTILALLGMASLSLPLETGACIGGMPGVGDAYRGFFHPRFYRHHWWDLRGDGLKLLVMLVHQGTTIGVALLASHRWIVEKGDRQAEEV